MQIVTRRKGKLMSVKTQELAPQQLKALDSEPALRILKQLHSKPMYPKQLAEKLKLHEQNVYYYIHKLEQARIVKVVREERLQGMIAKFYAPASASFFLTIGDFQESAKLEERESAFLKPFVEKGELQALIVVGSPDPHGPLKARSRDGYFGMDLALFLGTFLHRVAESRVKLDTEVQEKDLQDNHLIVLGGPIVNKVAEHIGKRVPMYFDEQKKGFYSAVSGKLYVHEEIGVIVKCKSPFNREKQLLFIAGVRNSGTKAAILAFLQQFEEIEKGNKFDREMPCKVVEGVDLDSDSVVDAVDVLE